MIFNFNRMALILSAGLIFQGVSAQDGVVPTTQSDDARKELFFKTLEGGDYALASKLVDEMNIHFSGANDFLRAARSLSKIPGSLSKFAKQDSGIWLAENEKFQTWMKTNGEKFFKGMLDRGANLPTGDQAVSLLSEASHAKSLYEYYFQALQKAGFNFDEKAGSGMTVLDVLSSE